MGDLYAALRNRAPVNAREVVRRCAEELPEYRAVAAHPDTHARMLDFAVHIRRRTLELVASDLPFTADDLSAMSTIGEERGQTGMSQPVARRILAVHIAAILREIHEACGERDLADTMHLLSWLGSHCTTAQDAYLQGFLRGQRHHRSIAGQVRRFTDLALAGDPAAPSHARALGIAIPARYQVIVTRTAGSDDPTALVNTAWRQFGAPATWPRPNQFVALLPAYREATALALVQEVATRTAGPYTVGTATGPLSTLDETFALARRVSQVARTQTTPDHLHTIADVFIEIGVAELPEIEHWLATLTDQLAAGTDLIATLDAFYANNLDRSRTAATLNIHPRTLDYRLRRTRELTTIDPHTTTGIRIFTTAITRTFHA